MSPIHIDNIRNLISNASFRSIKGPLIPIDAKFNINNCFSNLYSLKYRHN